MYAIFQAIILKGANVTVVEIVNINTLLQKIISFSNFCRFTAQRVDLINYRQGSAELGVSELPKKYFATDRTPNPPPKKKLSENKKPSKNTVHLAKVKHDMIIMDNRDYRSTRCIKLDAKKYC